MSLNIFLVLPVEMFCQKNLMGNNNHRKLLNPKTTCIPISFNQKYEWKLEKYLKTSDQYELKLKVLVYLKYDKNSKYQFKKTKFDIITSVSRPNKGIVKPLTFSVHPTSGNSSPTEEKSQNCSPVSFKEFKKSCHKG